MKARVLDLYSNQFTGQIPTELGNLGGIDELYLEHNSFSGTIPSQLGLLTTAILIHLHDNKLSGSVPPELCDLVATGLDLSVDCDLVDCSCACNCELSSGALP